MKWWQWLLLSVIPIIIASSRARKRHEQRFDLQFWDKELRPTEECWAYYQIHFPTMKMRYTFDCVGGPNSICFFDVRRNVNGTWESRYTETSFLIHVLEMDDRKASSLKLGLWLDENKNTYKKEKQEGNKWFAMGDMLYDGTLEVAYQKFLYSGYSYCVS